MSNQEIIALIRAKVDQERISQDAKWGGERYDDVNSMQDWLNIILRQLGLACEETARCKIDPRRWNRQMVRIIACAQAALESHYRLNPHLYQKTLSFAEGREGRQEGAKQE